MQQGHTPRSADAASAVSSETRTGLAGLRVASLLAPIDSIRQRPEQ
jgi:hypothetical protein